MPYPAAAPALIARRAHSHERDEQRALSALAEELEASGLFGLRSRPAPARG